MKKIAIALWSTLVATGTFAAAPDWSKVEPVKMTLFHPGQASFEWAMDKAEHSSVPDIVNKGRTCAKCHLGDANEVGDKIVKGQAAGNKKVSLEPNPVPGRAGSIPVLFRAAHDGSKIYFRLEWTSPTRAGEVLDKKNEIKAAIMFDGGGTVEGANLSGCWVTCHDDLKSMKSPRSDEKRKYLKDADLAGGKFYDYIQFRSGKGEPMVDGYIAEDRIREGGKSLVKAEGKKEGGKWVVSFERELAARGKGDHAIVPGKMYNFGVALHEGGSNFRFHHVSLGYQFALDEKGKEKNQISVVKQ